MQFLFIKSKSNNYKLDLQSLINTIKEHEEKGYHVHIITLAPILTPSNKINNETFILEDGTEVDYIFGDLERFTNIILNKNNFLDINEIANKADENITNTIEDFIFDKMIKEHDEQEKNKKHVCMIYFNINEHNPKRIITQSVIKIFKIKLQNNHNYIKFIEIDDNMDQKNKNRFDTVKKKSQKGSYLFDLFLKYFKENFLFINYLLKSFNNYQINKQLIFENHNQKEEKSKVDKKLIAIVGVEVEKIDSYCSVINALKFSEKHLNLSIEIKLLEASSLSKNNSESWEILKNADGILVPGGFGEVGAEGKILAIKYARKQKIPFLGICLGFQMAAVEFARNVLKLKNATSEEFHPDSNQNVVKFMAYEKKDKFSRSMRMGLKTTILKSDSQIARIYNQNAIEERYHHGYNINMKYENFFADKGLILTGKNYKESIIGSLELKDHPFFIGVQYHPEYSAKADKPHILISEFIKSTYYK